MFYGRTSFFLSNSMRITPVTGAAVVTALYGCVFVAAFCFAVNSTESFNILLPAVIASPTSFTPFANIIQTRYGLHARLIVSGIINAGLWFGLVFVLGSVFDWMRPAVNCALKWSSKSKRGFGLLDT